jgi:hypothetical protein
MKIVQCDEREKNKDIKKNFYASKWSEKKDPQRNLCQYWVFFYIYFALYKPKNRWPEPDPHRFFFIPRAKIKMSWLCSNTDPKYRS